MDTTIRLDREGELFIEIEIPAATFLTWASDADDAPIASTTTPLCPDDIGFRPARDIG